MNHERNEGYVLAQGDWTAIRFSLRAQKSTQPSFGVRRAFDIVQECFSPVLTVTEIEMTVKRRDPEVPLTQFSDAVSEFPDIENPIRVRHADGINSERLRLRLDELDVGNDELFVSPIRCSDTVTHVFLSDGLCRIAAGDGGANKRYKSDTPQGVKPDEPSGPAAFFDLTYAPEGYPYHRDSEEFVCEFRTVIDIWFGESPLAQINRARLYECFGALDTRFPRTDSSIINVMAGVSEQDVYRVLEYDGPSSESLIDRYCGQN